MPDLVHQTSNTSRQKTKRSHTLVLSHINVRFPVSLFSFKKLRSSSYFKKLLRYSSKTCCHLLLLLPPAFIREFGHLATLLLGEKKLLLSLLESFLFFSFFLTPLIKRVPSPQQRWQRRRRRQRRARSPTVSPPTRRGLGTRQPTKF